MVRVVVVVRWERWVMSLIVDRVRAANVEEGLKGKGKIYFLGE